MLFIVPEKEENEDSQLYFYVLLLLLFAINACKDPNYHSGIKLRYIENHAAQINSYYGTLRGSHGRSFRVHHEKFPEAPPGGEITMT